MLLFDLIAEQKITEAIARGELTGLPGEGKPLDLGDDAMIPQELRMAWRILKNAGVIPPQVETLREIGELERFIASLSAGERRDAAWRKLQLLHTRMEASGLRNHGFATQGQYLQGILDRFSRGCASRTAPR